MLDLLSVRYWIEAPGTPMPALPGLRQVYSGPDAVVLRDPRALPRAFVPQKVELAPSLDAAFAAIGAPGFVPGRTAVVEGGAASAGQGSARLTRDDPEALDIHASLRRGGLVVLGDPGGKGWGVTVDGHAARPRIVDGALRGVVVPAGTHVIRWRYRTPGLTAGLVLSVIGLIILVVWLIDPRLDRLRRRRRSGAATAHA